MNIKLLLKTEDLFRIIDKLDGLSTPTDSIVKYLFHFFFKYKDTRLTVVITFHILITLTNS